MGYHDGGRSRGGGERDRVARSLELAPRRATEEPLPARASSALVAPIHQVSALSRWPHDLDPASLSRCIRGLQGPAPLRDVSRRVLGQLIARAEPVTAAAGEVLCVEGRFPVAFYLLLSGLASVEREEGGARVCMFTLAAGQSFGVEALLGGRVCPGSLVAVERCRLLRFSPELLRAELGHSSALRRAARRFANETRPGADQELKPVDDGETVVLESGRPGLPLAAMTELLAQELVGEFGDSVLVVRPARRAGANPPTVDLHGVFHATTSPSRPQRSFPGFDYVFFAGFAPGAVSADLRVEIVDRSPPVPVVVPGAVATKVLVSVLISDDAPVAATLEGVPGGDPGIGSHFSPCYLRLDPLAVEGQWRAGMPLARCDGETRDSVARWARAISQRRVGVALSGGGAWGFYHVVALRRLVAAGVPIDLISSASIGSAVGAYFAVHGLAGLDQLIQFATRPLFNLDWMAIASTISSAAMELAMDHELDHAYLERLTTRFHPVTTNLTDGRSVIATAGPVGLAVRASASAPGLCGPTLLGAARYVDGCVTENLPALVLPRFGADLSFACNCYPYGTRDAPRVPRGAIGRFLDALNPIGRVADLACSATMMLHRSGDWEGGAADVFYNVRWADDPLGGATEFRHAEKFIQRAEEDELLAAKLDLFIARWQRLKRRGASSALRSPRFATPARRLSPPASRG